VFSSGVMFEYKTDLIKAGYFNKGKVFVENIDLFNRFVPSPWAVNEVCSSDITTAIANGNKLVCTNRDTELEKELTECQEKVKDLREQCSVSIDIFKVWLIVLKHFEWVQAH
jgi:hypothetical protein